MQTKYNKAQKHTANELQLSLPALYQRPALRVKFLIFSPV